ncbi:MAG: NifB/NifX family molybdenum-iron cluster-binding protein [Elusimicrobiota bacterium]
MIIGITIDEDKGLKSRVSSHFGQCGYFLIVEVNGKEISNFKVVTNSAQHGGGGCLAVDEILKHKVTHLIAGGMGANAKMKLTDAGVKVFSYSGIAIDAVKELLEKGLDGIQPCKEHGGNE